MPLAITATLWLEPPCTEQSLGMVTQTNSNLQRTHIQQFVGGEVPRSSSSWPSERISECNSIFDVELLTDNTDETRVTFSTHEIADEKYGRGEGDDFFLGALPAPRPGRSLVFVQNVNDGFRLMQIPLPGSALPSLPSVTSNPASVPLSFPFLPSFPPAVFPLPLTIHHSPLLAGAARAVSLFLPSSGSSESL
ncbi:hypothetical protein Tcan_00246 [Toxocara canis]|uniref:Uncharacterized protein n=1 Tax=Toxocara canis TaxID=6265 RepID=A0A0B2V6K7_TOXCA|nr:hypothetical protein Tcan_00246 [Toxocara canis]